MTTLREDVIDDRTYLRNGRFLHTLDGWSPSGASYLASDGGMQYGIALLAPGGGFVEQSFSVPYARSYTLHLAAKSVGVAFAGSSATVRIVDGAGNTVLTQYLSGAADTWTETEISVGLAPGGWYTLRIANASLAGGMRLDDVWLWWVPLSRSGLAARIHRKLGRLAADRGYTTNSSGTQTEGDYTDAVDSGLRSVGAISPQTDLPDVRYLDAALLDVVLDAIEYEMLERFQRDYLLEVDVATEQRRESLGQIAKTLGAVTGGRAGGTRGGGGGGGRVVVRSLRHRASEYQLGDE